MKTEINTIQNFNCINNSKIDIYLDDEYFLNRLYLTLYKSIPNERRIRNSFKIQNVVNYIIDTYNLKNKAEQIRYFKQVRKTKHFHTIIKHRFKTDREVYLIIVKDRFLIKVDDYSFTSVYDDSIELSQVINLEKEILKFVKKKNKKKHYFYMITKEYDGFGLNKFRIKDFGTNIDLHYNDDFKEFDKSAMEFLGDNKKSGLLLMHGLSGTGKTTYIRHLIKNIKRKFIFLPLFMAEALSSPDLIPFLTEQKNSILIIEDSEKLISSRESGTSQSGITTLLNLSDGLMSDALGIKLICTFNTGLSNIDKALLRKGRLINRYEFKELSVEKAKRIAEINKLPYDGKEAITIGDLFNIDSDNQTNAIARKSIGFKR